MRHIAIVKDRPKLLHKGLDMRIEVLESLLSWRNLLYHSLLLGLREIRRIELSRVMIGGELVGIHREARLGWSMLLRLH